MIAAALAEHLKGDLPVSSEDAGIADTPEPPLAIEPIVTENKPVLQPAVDEPIQNPAIVEKPVIVPHTVMQTETMPLLSSYVFLSQRAPALRSALEGLNIHTRSQLLDLLVAKGLNNPKTCEQLVDRFLDGKIIKLQQAEPALTSTARLIAEITGLTELAAYGNVAPPTILQTSLSGRGAAVAVKAVVKPEEQKAAVAAPDKPGYAVQFVSINHVSSDEDARPYSPIANGNINVPDSPSLKEKIGRTEIKSEAVVPEKAATESILPIKNTKDMSL